MTRVLIAADESAESLDAARSAHHLFGDDAEYWLIHVGQTPIDPNLQWGYAYPAVMPMVMMPAAEGTEERRAEEREAEQTAEKVASAAALDNAEAIGEVGDAAKAIIDAAHEHGVDVIVVGSHERSWFSRLMKGSVTQDIVRNADIPVLVVK